MSKEDEFTDRFPDLASNDRYSDTADPRVGGSHRDSDFSRLPSTGQPLNAEPRPVVTPLLAVALLIVVIVLVFLLITWLRYNS